MAIVIGAARVAIVWRFMSVAPMGWFAHSIPRDRSRRNPAGLRTRYVPRRFLRSLDKLGFSESLLIMDNSSFSVREVLAGKAPKDGPVTVRGWVRTRRDSKAGISFVH